MRLVDSLLQHCFGPLGFSRDVFLVSMDVTSLKKNIPQDDGVALVSARHTYDEFRDKTGTLL